MTKAIQIGVLVATFLTCGFLGSLLEFGYWQASYAAQEHLKGKPLPPSLDFLINNRRAIIPACLLPWLFSVAIPFGRSDRDYLHPENYLLWFIVWTTTEAIVVGLLALILVLPFLPYYMVLEEPTAATICEQSLRIVCAAIATAIFAVASIQFRRRHTTNREQNQAEHAER